MLPFVICSKYEHVILGWHCLRAKYALKSNPISKQVYIIGVLITQGPTLFSKQVNLSKNTKNCELAFLVLSGWQQLIISLYFLDNHGQSKNVQESRWAIFEFFCLPRKSRFETRLSHRISDKKYHHMNNNACAEISELNHRKGSSNVARKKKTGAWRVKDELWTMIKEGEEWRMIMTEGYEMKDKEGSSGTRRMKHKALRMRADGW